MEENLTQLEQDLVAEFGEESTPKDDTTTTPEKPSDKDAPVDAPAPETPDEPVDAPTTTPTDAPVDAPAPTANDGGDTPPQLILGKFKTQGDLEAAYQNLEKKLGEKAQQRQEQRTVTSKQFDAAVDQKIAEESWKLIDKAFATITDPEHAKEAQYLLSEFKRTGDEGTLEKARGFLDRHVDRQLDVQYMNTAASIRQTANAHRTEILLRPLSEELDKLADEDPEFMNDTQNQNLMAMAIKLNPETVDVRSVKKEIQTYGKSQWQKGYESAKKELAKQVEKTTVSVKSNAHFEVPPQRKDPRTMTTEEMLAEEYKTI